MPLARSPVGARWNEGPRQMPPLWERPASLADCDEIEQVGFRVDQKAQWGSVTFTHETHYVRAPHEQTLQQKFGCLSLHRGFD